MRKPKLTNENFRGAIFESINVGPLEFLTPVEHYGHTLVTDRRADNFDDALIGVITPAGVLQARNPAARAFIVREFREHQEETMESQFRTRFLAAFREN